MMTEPIRQIKRCYRQVDRAYQRGFNKLLFSCRHMSELTSQSLERPLSRREKVTRRLHMLLCAWCRRYDRQIRFLHRNFTTFASQFPERGEESLSQEARQRILQNVTDRHKDGS